MSETSQVAIIAVLGPTAAGKSALGLALARQCAAEIVCCDSAQVYRGLDIGTAKPTREEQAVVPHHLLDVVVPSEDFHAGQWAQRAAVAIREITARGRVAIVVGGTGLYFRALTRGLFAAPPPDPALRARHQSEAGQSGVETLHARLQGVDPEAAARIGTRDLMRISRALEVFEQTGVPLSELWRRAPAPMPLRSFTIIMEPAPAELRSLIDGRVDRMMAAGFAAEVAGLHAAGWGAARALRTLGYRELSQAMNGELTPDAAVVAIKKNTVAFARRQRTWFRKEDAAVRWPGTFSSARQGDAEFTRLAEQVRAFAASAPAG